MYNDAKQLLWIWLRHITYSSLTLHRPSSLFCVEGTLFGYESRDGIITAWGLEFQPHKSWMPEMHHSRFTLPNKLNCDALAQNLQKAPLGGRVFPCYRSCKRTVTYGKWVLADSSMNVSFHAKQRVFLPSQETVGQNLWKVKEGSVAGYGKSYGLTWRWVMEDRLLMHS